LSMVRTFSFPLIIFSNFTLSRSSGPIPIHSYCFVGPLVHFLISFYFSLTCEFHGFLFYNDILSYLVSSWAPCRWLCVWRCFHECCLSLLVLFFLFSAAPWNDTI
jgi:hypothetical protein